jgi:hypothetical protein
MKGALRETQARVGLLDRCIDLSSLADYWHSMEGWLEKRMSAAAFAAQLLADSSL